MLVAKLSENVPEIFKTDIIYITNLEPEEYLTILKECKFMIGNSSSGIIEAASFKIPVINLGTRQNGREQSKIL